MIIPRADDNHAHWGRPGRSLAAVVAGVGWRTDGLALPGTCSPVRGRRESVRHHFGDDRDHPVPQCGGPDVRPPAGRHPATLRLGNEPAGAPLCKVAVDPRRASASQIARQAPTPGAGSTARDTGPVVRPVTLHQLLEAPTRKRPHLTAQERIPIGHGLGCSAGCDSSGLARTPLNPSDAPCPRKPSRTAVAQSRP